MPRRATVALLLCCAMLLTGCRVDTAPTVVSRLKPDRSPTIGKARFFGEYRLLAAHSDKRGFTKPHGEPLATIALKPGQPLGFQRGNDGRLAAVAGAERFALDEGAGLSYLWEMRAEPGQIDGRKTTLLFVTVAVVTAVAATAIFASTWGGLEGLSLSF